MKILLLNWRDTTHPKAGGAERVTLEHAKAWVKRGHAVDFFTSGYNSADSTEYIDGVRILRRGGSMTVYIFAALYLIRFAKNYDVIVDEIHALPCFSFFIRKTPIVAFIHEVAGDIWDSMFFFPLNKIGKFIEPLLLQVYNWRHIPFWTDSSSMVEELVSLGIARERCTAIPCPITNEIPSRWHEKDTFPHFLFVSRVVPMKGIEAVIKAFALIKKTEPRAHLSVVGGGEKTYITILKNMINNLDLSNAVTFCGKVTEEKKLEYMGRSHILLHASIKEGWGLVVLEAASQGTPSVVYNVSGLRDVVKNGKTGIVIHQNTPEELAKAALDLYENVALYKTFQKNGKEWTASIKWNDVTDQSLELLTKTAAKNLV